jgi:hypothetical protein
MVSPLPYGDWEGEKDLILYPVRGIRRKNLGEVLLLSQFLPADLKMGITLPPNSPKDAVYFKNWKGTAKKLDLPVIFNIGEKEDFSAILGRTRFVITTSIKEGFGFSYLEPWTIGKEVRGRYLKSVCPDFEEKGIRFNNLYKELLVPLKSFELESFISRWQNGIMQLTAQYDVNISADEIREDIEHRLVDHSIDFGLLDETAQTQVIEAVYSSPEIKTALNEINPWLVNFFSTEDYEKQASDGLFETNRKIILKVYGSEHYRKQLLCIYRKLKHHVPQKVEKKKVLDAFLKIENYTPLGS